MNRTTAKQHMDNAEEKIRAAIKELEHCQDFIPYWDFKELIGILDTAADLCVKHKPPSSNG